MTVITNLEVKREDVIALFGEIGKDASNWTNKKLLLRIKGLEEFLTAEDAKEPTSEEGCKLMESLLEAVSSETEIVLLGEKEDKPSKAPSESKDEVVEPEEEKAPEFTVSTAYTFEEAEKPKLVKLTKELAKKYQGMQRFPRDRELSPSRCEHLKREIMQGTFRGAEWVSCLCGEDNQIYRINGKHTSHVLCEMYDNGLKPEATMLIREYKAPTLEDVAYLFATYDPKWSSRSKRDLLMVFSAAHEKTKEIPPRLLSPLTAGVAYTYLEDRYRRLSTEEQSTLLLQHDEFAGWCSDLLSEEMNKHKHLIRMSVMAAMLKTWQADPEAANEFWEALRDDCDDPKESPRRNLYRWLNANKVGGRDGRERVGEREVYYYCLKAWNAWRNKEATVKLTHYKKESKTPEVV